MVNETSPAKSLYFSTRDLLTMAVLAALGGVTSTYVNTIGDAAQAALGFPGATQWAAGLHTIWIVLAMGILRKTGAGTVMGILKGSVELMSGNSHGVIILLINLMAGLLVDFGFFIFRDKRSLAPYLVAGGLSAGSNVIIFQLFATLPTNILAMSAILILILVATTSGVIFSGLTAFFLVNALIKANVIKLPEKILQNRKIGWYILGGVSLLAIFLTVYMQFTLKGSPTIQISGAVMRPYEFPTQAFSPDRTTQKMDYRGVLTEYTGYRLQEFIEYAQPLSSADTLLVEASDGYAFLISFEELNNNPNILLVERGRGDNAAFDLVGPISSKAWVRNVVEITISIAQGLRVQLSSDEAYTFEPDNWLSDMDSAQVLLPAGPEKLQGVPLWKILEPIIENKAQVVLNIHADKETLTFAWQDIVGDQNLRIFPVIGDDGFTYALATMSGEVYLYPLAWIEVN